MSNKNIYKWICVSAFVWTAMLAGVSAQNIKNEIKTAKLHDSITAPTVTRRTPIKSVVALEAQFAPQVRTMTLGEARALYGKCGEWKRTALEIGWAEEEWETLSKVMFRESRCDVMAHNQTDPMSGSRGLLQINGYWCKPSRYSQNGWLQDRGVLITCDDLYQPEINLKAGLLIWLYGEEKHGCGWRGPWATSCKE